jgi:hypothetical protein
MFGRAIVGSFLILFIVVGLGLVATFVGYSRQESDRSRGLNNVRQLGVALFHATRPGQAVSDKSRDSFPPAILPGKPEREADRLCWTATLLHALDRNPDKLKADAPSVFSKVWQTLDADLPCTAEPNLAAGKRRIPAFLNPGTRQWEVPGGGGLALSHYQASAGIGTHPPEGPARINAGKEGVFALHDDRPLSAIKDGTSNTISLVETVIGSGAWIGQHPSSTFIFTPGKGPLSDVVGGVIPGTIIVGFADGSTRVLTVQADERVVLSQLTIDGSEKLGDE